MSRTTEMKPSPATTHPSTASREPLPRLGALLTALITGLALSAAWCTPGSPTCATLSAAAALALALLSTHEQRPYFTAWLAGSLTNALGSYWLFDTIKDFGGFPAIAAGGIFAFFVAISALQFPVFILCTRLLRPSIGQVIAPALGWVCAELISVRIFPWYLGHGVLGWLPLAQAADLAGVPLLSFLLVWVASGVIVAVRQRRVRPAAAPALALFAALWYGSVQMKTISAEISQARTQRVAVIQGAISIEDKHNIKQFAQNLNRYLTLTQEQSDPHSLTIWPESVLTEWIPATIAHRQRSAVLSRLPEHSPMLIGALTFEGDPREKKRPRIFNSAMAVLPDGAIPPPYHKRILMPFGEYTPFGNLLPWLRELNGTAGDFSRGDGPRVFEYPMLDSNGVWYTMKASPLICYEDVVPSLAREATVAGAELLVNLTNDAWFGPTVAPEQHHLIASFRAIENRRSLVRSTNSGLTAVIDPLGRTTGTLTGFSEGTLLAEVPLIRYRSIYTTLGGEMLWWMVLCASAVVVLYRRLRAPD